MLKRYITAAIVLPIFSILIEFTNHYVVSVIILIASLLAIEEYIRIQQQRGFALNRITIFLGSIVTIAGSVIWYDRGLYAGFWLGLAILAFGALLSSRSNEEKMITMPLEVFGVLISFLLGHMILLYTVTLDNPERGRDLIFYFLAVTWLGDTAAYHIGKKYGKHKLAPVISPGKTIEGFIACILGGIAISFVFDLYLCLNIPAKHLVILGFILPIAGQLGDLLESIFKRGVNMKDSSGLLPGHGGMFDRIDSIWLTAPLLYFYCKLILHF